MNRREVFEKIYDDLTIGRYDVHGDELRFDCPFCGDTKGHFEVNSRKLVYHCFKCHESGSIWGPATDNPEAMRTIRKSAESEVRVRPSMDSAPIVWDGYKLVAEPGASTDGHHRYCLRRGMTDGQLFRYRVMARPWDLRVWFPVWQGETTIYYVGRALPEDVEPKTIEPAGAEKTLYGLHVWDHYELHTTRSLILVEGVFDHFVTPGSVAMLGSTLSGRQLDQLKHIPNLEKVGILGDPDSPNSIIQTAKLVNQHTTCKAVPIWVHADKDPADIGRETMQQVSREIRGALLRQKISSPLNIHL